MTFWAFEGPIFETFIGWRHAHQFCFNPTLSAELGHVGADSDVPLESHGIAALRELYAAICYCSRAGRVQSHSVDARPAPRDAGLFLRRRYPIDPRAALMF